MLNGALKCHKYAVRPIVYLKGLLQSSFATKARNQEKEELTKNTKQITYQIIILHDSNPSNFKIGQKY